MKLTKDGSKKLREGLPEDAVSRIAAKKKITARMVRYILAGDSEDKHGVVNEALAIRTAHAKKLLKPIKLK